MKKLIIILLAITFPLLTQSPSSARVLPNTVTFGQEVVDVASEYIGYRYCRGGESPRCFDCSGLTQFVYSKIGVNLPRTGGEQLELMQIISVEEAQPGDMVFFPTKSGYIYHVGIYIGDGQMIHSPKPGQRVKVAPVFERVIYATIPSVPTT
jgi:cell wall-associated NlpC family hydrolase